MSWSVFLVGKAKAVGAKARKDFSQIKCPEPEQSIVSALGVAVDTALASFPDDQAVKLQCSGSQGDIYGIDGYKLEGKFTQTVNVSIETIWGFLG